MKQSWSWSWLAGASGSVGGGLMSTRTAVRRSQPFSLFKAPRCLRGRARWWTVSDQHEKPAALSVVFLIRDLSYRFVQHICERHKTWWEDVGVDRDVIWCGSVTSQFPPLRTSVFWPKRSYRVAFCWSFKHWKLSSEESVSISGCETVFCWCLRLLWRLTLAEDLMLIQRWYNLEIFKLKNYVQFFV